jgi:hypothetical protein
LELEDFISSGFFVFLVGTATLFWGVGDFLIGLGEAFFGEDGEGLCGRAVADLLYRVLLTGAALTLEGNLAVKGFFYGVAAAFLTTDAGLLAYLIDLTGLAFCFTGLETNYLTGEILFLMGLASLGDGLLAGDIDFLIEDFLEISCFLTDCFLEISLTGEILFLGVGDLTGDGTFWALSIKALGVS